MEPIIDYAIAGAIMLGSILTPLNATDPYTEDLSKKVIEIVNNTHKIPGINLDKLPDLKPKIIDHWNELVREGSLLVDGKDADYRDSFVSIQMIMEHVLTQQKEVSGIILTPMPSTPLCTEGEVTQDLVDGEVYNDPSRKFTVTERAVSSRLYVEKGGNLYIAYPKKGFEGRNQKQQEVYRETLKKYGNEDRQSSGSLYDRPLDCGEIEQELIGATYFFKDPNEKVYVFAIKMTQANASQPMGSFGLWFGPIENAEIYARVKTVTSFVNKFLDSTEQIPLPF